MEEWYYKRADSELGPISEAELRALLEQEKNAAEIQIRRKTSEEWVSATAVQPATQRPLSVPAPLPPAIPYQSRPQPSVRIITGPTGWLWFSAMLLAIDLVVLVFIRFVFAIYALFLLAGITGLPDWFIQCVNAFDSRVIWPQGAMFVLLILWQGCAFGSILRLYSEGLFQHGRRSGFWWITPVANLFMPFQCLRELRWASQKKRSTPESDISAGVLAWLIQGVIIFNILVAIADKLVVAASSATPDAEEATTTTISTAINLASNLGSLVLAGLLTVFVLRNLIHQIRLYRGWNTPEAVL